MVLEKRLHRGWSHDTHSPYIYNASRLMSHLSRDKTKLLGRVRRLKGQIEAIERAVEDEKDCGAILHLVASVRGAMTGLTNELLDEHLQHHVLQAEDEEARRKGVEVLSSALRSYLK